MSAAANPESSLPQPLWPEEHEALAAISVFSEAKNGQPLECSEDIFESTGGSYILADGSTAKGPASDAEVRLGKSGGRIAAEIVCETCRQTDANGPELVRLITDNMRAFYAAEHPEALGDPQRRFAATLLVARRTGDDLVITQVGDTGFRINGGAVHTEQRTVDRLDAQARSAAIQAALDRGMDEAMAVKLGREYITPSLQRQHVYRNNPNHWLGFGYIDGGDGVPEQFVKTYRLPAGAVHTLEMFSDGYVVAPDESTVEAWEEGHRQLQAADPLRYRQYPATKPQDDRLVAIIEFGLVA